MIALRGVDKEEVARRAKAGDRAAEERLVEIHTPYVMMIARRYLRRCQTLTFEDLMVAGQMGILRALVKFDLDAGVLFLTYAGWWVRASIEREIADNDLTIRVPVHVQDAQRQIFNGRTPVTETVKKRADHAARLRRTRSLDAPIGEEGQLLVDTIADPSALADEVLLRGDGNGRVRAVLQAMRFSPKEQIVLERRLMGEATLQDIADIFQLSRERIRQIESVLIARLREALKAGGCAEAS